MFSITRSVFEPQRRRRGFTLVELMVALAVGMLLAVAILITQLKLSGQNTRTADVGNRDNEMRAVLGAIVREIGGAGFLDGGSEFGCFATINYNNTLSTNYYISYAAWGMAASKGTPLPFISGTGVTLNYPDSATTTNKSDVLVVRAATDGTQFPATVSPTFAGRMDSSFNPMGDGNLPVQADSGVAASLVGKTAILAVPLSTLNSYGSQTLCMRVPIGSVSTSGSSYSIGGSGNRMPSNNYTGFGNQVASTGMTGTLSNAVLEGQAKMTVIGTAATSNQRTYAYYIDASNYPSTTKPVPTLVRSTINAVDDTLIGTSTPIAAGVVSFQLRFGIGNDSSQTVTAYQDAATMTANKTNGYVRTVKIAVLTRSLYDDKDYDATKTYAGGVIPISGFSSYTIPSSETHRHFALQIVELPVRNNL